MRCDHAPYTAAVHTALVDAGHTPEQVRTVTEATGLRRSLLRLSGLRVLWEEEKGWSAADADGQVWWCTGGVVVPPERVVAWVEGVHARQESARGAELSRVPGSALERELLDYVDPAWAVGPASETDPAWA
ncbi:hypothetical protein ABZ234_07935 [Nocardiopsis sp. NPDC006198]|uniref:hypothetical protein n=1 Tax=Nocardiopsis sp. NPDC006198 TaxID=3154472 RepID=UPI0033B0BF0D